MEEIVFFLVSMKRADFKFGEDIQIGSETEQFLQYVFDPRLH